MKYAITNTTIVMTDHLIPNGTIVIEDGKILDFGKTKDIDTTGVECYDAGGRYTGPGLMDIHTGGHQGRQVNFENTVIIMTTNAGSESSS